MINLVMLGIACILTWVVFWDSGRLPMKHRNLWIVGTFLLFPLFFPLYVIRRSQVRHQGKMSERQKREAALREDSRRRRQNAEEARQKWREQKLKEKMKDPLGVAAAVKKEYAEQHEMRILFDEQLKQQQKLREKKMKIRD